MTQVDIVNEQELSARQLALQLASKQVQVTSHGATPVVMQAEPDAIIETAGKYLSFLLGAE